MRNMIQRRSKDGSGDCQFGRVAVVIRRQSARLLGAGRPNRRGAEGNHPPATMMALVSRDAGSGNSQRPKAAGAVAPVAAMLLRRSGRPNHPQHFGDRRRRMADVVHHEVGQPHSSRLEQRTDRVGTETAKLS